MSESMRDTDRLSSMAPPDPPPPYKTWRGTLVLTSMALALIAVIAFMCFRWAQLQSFSPELRFEGTHRFSGTLLSPKKIFGSDMIKFRLRTEDGRVLILPPAPDTTGDLPRLTSYPEGTCAEGYVENHKGYMAVLEIGIEGKSFLLTGQEGWIATEKK
jgi:hypothetical protein